MKEFRQDSIAFNKCSVVLASTSAVGTIAAVRQLGASGIDVSVISSEFLGAAARSRYAKRSYSAPLESANDRFLERLLAIGKANPGRILLPTSDKTAWLYTVNAALLERYFYIYQPSIATMRRILDKMLLYDAAVSAGLAVLPSWSPRNITDLEALAPTLPYPILIKPRTHVYRLMDHKGIVVHSANALIHQYQQFIIREKVQAVDTPLMPDANRPILQPFVKVERTGVHSVTGFIDRTGEFFITRQSSKVLLRSQPVGVGVCFESVPTDLELSQAVHRLCRELSYFGVFEVEFVWSDGRWAVIDFNPRFYNQMAMDIRRGMPLPLMACLDAWGEQQALRDVVAKAQEGDDAAGSVFCDRFTMGAILFAQTVTLRGSREDRAYWRGWIKRNADRAVDAVLDYHDPMPIIFHVLLEIYLGLKAFPRFLRSPTAASSVTPGLST
jgi:D-aspartate ligase